MMKSARLRAAIAGLWTLVLIFNFCGCKQQQKPAAPPPPRVSVAQPASRELTEYLELTGNTQAIYTVQLVARVAGYLEKVLFKDGQMVKKGQMLFEIQRNTYEDALRQAEAQILYQKAQLEYATIQFERYTELLPRKAAAQADVDNWRYQRDSAKANLQNARAQRDLAALNLSYTRVKAPFTGRIDRRLQDPGNYVGSGGNTPLAAINQIDPIYAYFNISDTDLARLTKITKGIPGQGGAGKWPAQMGLVGEDGYPHEGRLDFASISLAPTTGTLLMRGIFPNASGVILPGLYARVRVPMDKRPAALVPETALGSDQQGQFVLVVNEQSAVERRNVRTGPVVDVNQRAVSEGLNGSEWVIVEGIQKVKPGQAVTAVVKPAAPAGSGPQVPPPENTEAKPQGRKQGQSGQ